MKKIDLSTPKNRRKIFLAKFVVLLILAFMLFYGISKFYDNYKVNFQNPITLILRMPVVISQRLFLAPIPKASYVEVSPLTTPQEIVDATKQGTIPQYADSTGIKAISRDTIRTLMHNLVVQKWGDSNWPEIDYIITHESDYNPYIVNKNSGACGLFQALPCTKLPSLDIVTQINWGLNYYIPERYKTPQNAFQFKKANGWY
jgi:hypothetical protein